MVITKPTVKILHPTLFSLGASFAANSFFGKLGNASHAFHLPNSIIRFFVSA